MIKLQTRQQSIVKKQIPTGVRPKEKKELPDEVIEEIKPKFTETGDFDDSCDVPIGAVIEHVMSEGKEPVEGIVELEDGGLTRLAEAEDRNIEAPEVAKVEEEKEVELGRGKRAHTSTKRLHEKDWLYTYDEDVVDEGVKKKRQRRG